jgi:diguanylate cyclase (GGDEF)-like protein
MNSKINDKLIHESEFPKKTLHKLVIYYPFLMVTLIIIISIKSGDISRFNLYFFINFLTVTAMSWFISKSFILHSVDIHLSVFRTSLFFLINSSLASMIGGLNLIERDIASLISAILFALGMLMIIYFFNDFKSYANRNYKSAINLSLTDELTGLPNRRHLNIKLSEIENKTVTICIADIDHFKKINDVYGHVAGDNVLKNTGCKLGKFANDKVFIARSGGEEFSIVIFDSFKTEEIIRNIKASISDGSNGDVNVTLSVGVAVKKNNQSSSSALTAADDALYKAKKSGRNCIMYAPIFHD